MNEKTTKPAAYPLPTPISVALMTGRPELARYGGEQGNREFSDYAEGVVREIQAERENIQIMYNYMGATLDNMRAPFGRWNVWRMRFGACETAKARRRFARRWQIGHGRNSDDLERGVE